MTSEDTYERLLALLDSHGAGYRVIEHAPEGRTDRVSALRGHPATEAAKCLILRVKLDRKRTHYVLAVVPGDRQLDLDALKRLLGARYAGFAEADTAERLAASVAGTVLPFALHPDLELIVDPEVLDRPTLYFNAARLDRSLALDTEDYRRIAQPRVAPIAAPADGAPAERSSYDIRLDDKFGQLALIDVAGEAAAHEPWFNQTLTSVNDAVVRLGVIDGDFHWHKHDDTDEFFLVLDGQLLIDIEGGESVVLEPHQGFTVPRGIVHRTRAPRRTSILMVEATGVVPTGD